ncbi:hypothetical protein OEZ85_012308 [Tetradesmus obliquus]|uniref:Kinesin-like protein n=1 Tax=Tetradesmus obliquus TaxID=3088 RepID=A0ABY8TV94_TETOB|nr:hypothetical protein OEZ85_012308 [Tetradesmus obliquus]
MGQHSKADAECVRVVVRCRPLNEREKADGRTRIVDMDRKSGQVVLRNSKADATDPPKSFTFDSVFDWESTQKEVYESTAAGIVNSTLEGYNGTIFAYGQTGTGKTHTMEGYAAEPSQQGIIPQSFIHIFSAIEGSSNIQYLVRASFLEIYNEEIRDLLSKSPKDKLELKESKDSGVYVKGLNAFVVKSVPEIRNVLEVGKKNRSVGATLMNQDSSRSHSVFTITIETIEQGPASDGHVRVGKLNLVDLAGSERQSKTGATGDRLKEATKINLSLSALGNVISALVDSKSGHIPYRDSKLTRLLQDSLGGNTKTVMVANVGPADWNYDETLSTLRYANRAKNITNRPRINEDPKDAMLREFQAEIQRLKAALTAAESGGGGGELVTDAEGHMHVEKVVQVPKPLDPQELEQLKQQIASELHAQLAASSGGKELTQEQLAQVAAETEAKAAAEAARLEAAAKAAEQDAVRYERKQRQLQEKLAKAAQEGEQLAQQKAELAARLRAMEGKILKGEARGGLVQVTRKKEEQLARREQELQRRRAEEAAAAAEIARVEEAALEVGHKFSSLAEEAAEKTKKLKKLWKRYQSVDAEVQDLYREFQAEKEDLLDSIRLLGQQMLLKDAVISAFIPQEEVDQVLQRAHWDDEAEINFTKAAALAGDMNPRFRSENILALELDMPERVTFDVLQETGAPDPRAQAAIDAAFWEDGHILLLGPPGSPQQQLHLVGPEGVGGYAMQQQQQRQGVGGGAQQRPGSSASRRR